MGARRVLAFAAASLLCPATTATPTPPGSWTVAVADSMTNVRRDWRPDTAGAISATGVYIELAKNEAEGAQLVVTASSTAPVKGLRWGVGQAAKPGEAKPGLRSAELRDAAGHVLRGQLDLAPLGYIREGPCPFDTTAGDCPPATPVHCAFGTNAAWDGPTASNCTTAHEAASRGPKGCIGCSGALGNQVENGLNNLYPGFGHDASRAFADRGSWWPFPLLDWVNTSDVAAGSSQAIMFTVTTELGAMAGKYTGIAELIDAAGTFVHIPASPRAFVVVLCVVRDSQSHAVAHRLSWSCTTSRSRSRTAFRRSGACRSARPRGSTGRGGRSMTAASGRLRSCCSRTACPRPRRYTRRLGSRLRRTPPT